MKCLQCKKCFAERTYRGAGRNGFAATPHRQSHARDAVAEMRPNEFYTPPHIIEIARACMGGIDPRSRVRTANDGRLPAL